MFLIYLGITWSKVMSPNDCMRFHLYHEIWFGCLFWNFDIMIKKIGNTKSGSSKNETKNSYYKVVTKCDRSLLQSASGIVKCDRLLLQSASRITKCDSCYKVRRNTCHCVTSFIMSKKNSVLSMINYVFFARVLTSRRCWAMGNKIKRPC